LAFLASEAAGQSTTTRLATVTLIPHSVVATYPHDPTRFTQGLEFISADTLLESTGLVGRSVLSKQRLSGDAFQTLAQAQMTGNMFGEGVTVFANKAWWWSWQDELGYTYNSDTLALLGNFTYKGEGWGLTHSPETILSSNGSALITFRDANFLPTSTLQLTQNGRAVNNLNELEYLDPGTPFNPSTRPSLFANIWQTGRIVRADLATGVVDGFLDLTDLVRAEQVSGGADVLNGIARDEAGRLWVTGKLWKNFYVLVPGSGTTAAGSVTAKATATSSRASGAATRLRRTRWTFGAVFAVFLSVLVIS
jgi:glutamine cyclotransferase